ncbi:MAG: hypothetical protein JW749_10490 [Sedimentisphaerales bacterium]|nr:hypothetical protein [Sedimentisphaerales bacterium]
MIFFFDECISEYAARMLGSFDRRNEMRASIDNFDKGTPDEEWLPKVSSWGDRTVVVSGDARILRNQVQRQVLKECKIAFVYLAPGWTKLPWEEYAWRIVKVWPDIVKNVEQAPYPSVFEVSLGLKVQPEGRIK